MGRPRKVKQADPDPLVEEARAAISEAMLREILKPFAEWAWGKEDGQKVIDKYFRQQPFKG